MRKTGTLLFILFTTFAVTLPALDVTVGPRVGLGYAFFYGDDYSDYLDAADAERAFTLGFVVGAFAEIGMLPFLAIQPEVLFSGGGAYENLNPGYRYIQTTHVELPVLVKAKFVEDLIHVFAGPNLMIPVGQWTSETDSMQVDIDMDTVADAIFGTVFGVGIRVPAGNGRFEIDLRGHLALTPYGESSVSPDYRTGLFLTTVGYAFDL